MATDKADKDRIEYLEMSHTKLQLEVKRLKEYLQKGGIIPPL